MKCEKAKILMNASIDNEISNQDMIALEQHMDSCDSCTVEFEELKYIVQATGELELKELPIGFETELHNRLLAVNRADKKQKTGKSKIKFFIEMATRKQSLAIIGTAAVLLLAVFAGKNLLGGMGSNDMVASEMSSDGYAGVMDQAAPEMSRVEMPAGSNEFTVSFSEEAKATGVPAPTTTAQDNDGYREGRMIIQSANLRLDIEDYDEKFNRIRDWVTAAGGFVENESTSYKTNYNDRENLKYGYMTLRIPASEYGRILEDIKTLGNVISDYANAYDVTKQYRDTASEIENLKVTETRLREIMEQAVEIEDILAIENELTRIRGSINAYEKQLKDWETLVDLTTVTVELNEVESLKPIIESIDDSLWGKAKEGFIQTINSIRKGIEKSFIWIISKSPILFAIAVLAFVINKIYKKRRTS
jgi:hypothetical protein